MTVIAAAVTEDMAMAAADQEVTRGDSLRDNSRLPKIRQVKTPYGPAIIGAAGDAAACNIATFLTKMPAKKKGESEFQYFVDSVPQAFLKAMVDRKRNPAEMDFEIMLARPGEIWTYDTYLAADLVGSHFWAIGSGSVFTMGFLSRIADITKEDIEESVDICGAYVPGVGGACELIAVHKSNS